MKRLKYLLMMTAMAITLCVGVTACGDEDDKNEDEPTTGTTGGGEDDGDVGDPTSDSSISVSGANWSFNRYYFYAEQSEDYNNGLDLYFLMQGEANGKTFCMTWNTSIANASYGSVVNINEFKIIRGSLNDDEDDMEDLCTYEHVLSGTTIVTNVTNSTCLVKFKNETLRTYDDFSDYGFPGTVTLNGSATFRYLE